MLELSDDDQPTPAWLIAQGFHTEGDDGRPVYGRALSTMVSPVCPNQCCMVRRFLVCDFEKNCLFLAAVPPAAELQIIPIALSPTVGLIKRILAEPAWACDAPPSNLYRLN